MCSIANPSFKNTLNHFRLEGYLVEIAKTTSEMSLPSFTASKRSPSNDLSKSNFQTMVERVWGSGWERGESGEFWGRRTEGKAWVCGAGPRGAAGRVCGATCAGAAGWGPPRATSPLPSRGASVAGLAAPGGSAPQSWPAAPGGPAPPKGPYGGNPPGEEPFAKF